MTVHPRPRLALSSRLPFALVANSAGQTYKLRSRLEPRKPRFLLRQQPPKAPDIAKLTRKFLSMSVALPTISILISLRELELTGGGYVCAFEIRYELADDKSDGDDDDWRKRKRR